MVDFQVNAHCVQFGPHLLERKMSVATGADSVPIIAYSGCRGRTRVTRFFTSLHHRSVIEK